MTFKPTVLKIESDKEFRWLGRIPILGLFSGEHFFIIKPSSEGKLTFIHGEKFKGLMLPMLRKSLEGETQGGFVEMNKALKARAESKAKEVK
jgi:hypothetical protein